ncbi:MAG: putative transposase, partial [Myxococcota bacterium]
MTVARPIYPGALWFVTCRCHQRNFRLLPGPEVNQLFRYLLAVGAERFGILPVAMYVASTHYHLVLEDPDAEMPAFLQWMNSLVARFLNARDAECDALWSTRPHCALLPDPDAVVAKIGYALANPVKDGLVPHGRLWPGVRTRPNDFWRPAEQVERPRSFFRPTGKLPDSALLRWHVPSSHADLSPKEFGQVVAAEVGAVE